MSAENPTTPAVTVERMSGAEYVTQWTSAYEQRRDRDARAFLANYGPEWALEECHRAEVRAWRRYEAGAEEERDTAMYLGEVAEHLSTILAAGPSRPATGDTAP